MVACMFRICAAAATPWAWLPEENATTPPPRELNGIDDSLLKAPRNLNEPVRCSISGFRNPLVPARSLTTGRDSSGVRTANGASTRAAASISTELTGRVENGSVIGDLYRVPQHAGKTLNCDQATKPGRAAANGAVSLSGSALRTLMIFSTNARAEASPVCLAANARQACGEIVSADRQAIRKSSFKAPTGAAPITSRGPVTGNAATGRPLARASRSTRPKRPVLLGNRNTSPAAEPSTNASPLPSRSSTPSRHV